VGGLESISIPLFIVTLSWYGIKEQVEDIDVSLDGFLSIPEVLPLESLFLTGLVPVDLTIPVLELSFTVGIKVCRFRDVIVVLRGGGEMNLFAVFPISATIQDGGKRKRSNELVYSKVDEIL